ncbi:MAG: polysaccharide pyruvyl transferase family protein [Selenomonadaceae bacterium]|nr:polysaccharide pyruvyl transferase family protein [Selenomonadaceae bacterium]
MRVAMLTLNVYTNYGNVIQKYALYRTLGRFADFVEVLWHHTTVPFLPYKMERDRWEEGNRKKTVFETVRQFKNKAFSDANIRTRFDIEYLEDIADDYDFFVVGSDQVWNPDFELPGRFLDFAPPEKRIAYAASITRPNLPKEVKKTYREKVLEMPHVSVREKDGCDLLEKLTGKRPLQVLDPVFLLPADEWRKVSKKPAWLDNKIYENGYLLTYFFDGQPPQEVYALAKQLGLPVVNLLDRNNFNHYANGVEEFLYLMSHATIICTRSFHGTAFSMIFERPFIIYKVGTLLTTRFSRISSLLELFGLSDRVAEPDFTIKLDDPLKIDFSRFREVLPLERKKAFRFLANAFWE